MTNAAPAAPAVARSSVLGSIRVDQLTRRWRWTKNSVARWDNRSTQHYAVQDYWPAVRKMERAGIIGDRPY